MPLYQVDIEGRSPLCVQLTATTKPIRVVGWDAYGSSAQGVTTRPVLYFPSVPGTGRASRETAYPTCLDQDGPADATAEIVTIFATLPSLPSGGVQFSADLPFRSSQAGMSVVLQPGQSAVLYATTDFEGSAGVDTDVSSRVHRWDASVQWVE